MSSRSPDHRRIVFTTIPVRIRTAKRRAVDRPDPGFPATLIPALIHNQVRLAPARLVSRKIQVQTESCRKDLFRI
jgi:hypothetical protein